MSLEYRMNDIAEIYLESVQAISVRKRSGYGIERTPWIMIHAFQSRLVIVDFNAVAFDGNIPVVVRDAVDIFKELICAQNHLVLLLRVTCDGSIPPCRVLVKLYRVHMCLDLYMLTREVSNSLHPRYSHSFLSLAP